MIRFRTLLGGVWIVVFGVLVSQGCKRSARSGSAQGATAAPVKPGESPASAAADPAAVAAPLPPPGAQLTVADERRFIPAQIVNAYSPAAPGDYNAQLELHNRVLKKWTVNAGFTPSSLRDIMASFGPPKPPQPPAGRTLVYDPKTVRVSLQ